MQILHQEATSLFIKLNKWSFTYVLRNKNKVAVNLNEER